MFSLLTAASLVGGSGLVVPADPPSAPPPTPDGLPITDPGWEPVMMGIGHEPDVQAAFNTPTVLFVNFDGPFMNGGCGNDSVNDCSQIFPNTQFNPSPASDVTRAAVIQATREDVVDFGVIVVGERPPAGNPYAMVVAGTPAGGGPPGVGGVAPGIDCGNTNPNITSFSFLVSDGPNIQATVIHQEAAHTWGLEHVDDDTDNLFPSVGGAADPKYNDVCSTVVSNVQLDPTGASCNSVHTMFCPSNQQNSYQEMLLLFGPPIPDQVAPTVVIQSPAEGEVFDYDDDFDLTIVLDDDRRPQVMDTVIFFDDDEAADAVLIDKVHTFPVSGGDPPGGHGLSNGLHTIRVDTVDEAGNPASDEVTIEIVGSPVVDPGGTGGGSGGVDESGGGTEGTPGGTAGDGTGSVGGGASGFGEPTSDQGCGCHSAGSPRSGAPRYGASLLLLVLAGLRRRRASA
ncbi:MAG: hypothetical protein AB1Z98_02805 [Nannocystaceae bacterium]